ncbi:MAG: suppressor of fused domain protein [bacterium]
MQNDEKPGQKIIRHQERTDENYVTPEESDTSDVVGDHLRKFFGDEGVSVFHEFVSDVVHIDVFMVKPGEGRPFNILMTSGMSSRAMNAPEDAQDCKYAEIAMFLPADWKLDQESFRDENNYWPIRHLKKLATLPHWYKTWLWGYHSMPNGNPAEPVASNTKFSGFLLLPSLVMSDEFMKIETGEKTIYVFVAVPIYTEEMRVLLESGSETLLPIFEAEFKNPKDLEVVNIHRKNVCRKFLGIF